MNALDIVMRWVHLMSAVTAAGGTFFALFVLIPAMRMLSDDERARLHEVLRPRFARLVMISIAALLLSGLYNYIVVKMPQHGGQGLYHGLMGAKILLAMAVFFVASALLGRAKAFEAMRQRRAKWLAVNAVMVTLVIAIGAVLGKMPVTP